MTKELTQDGKDKIISDHPSTKDVVATVFDVVYPITRQFIIDDNSSGKQWWWLSFADDDKGGFLGAVTVRATCFLDAINVAHLLGINPGGQVRGQDIPDDMTVPEWARNKLLTKEECAKVDEDFAAQMIARGVTAEDGVECPNCHNGTVVSEEGELRCAGECGAVLRRDGTGPADG